VHSDLERVIALQRLDSAAEDARRRLAEEPDRRKALEERIAVAGQRLAQAKERLSATQTVRRTLEKDLAVVQGRLSKFRDQLMEVKTNREYQAMQKEIEVAQAEVKAVEEKILERMLEDLHPGDVALFMSNGPFDNLPRRLLEALENRAR